ncbi:MAG: universal stress protein [Nitrososphaerota archaeon]|nr:universal stress protein [Nitrososphaerota archaeon]
MSTTVSVKDGSGAITESQVKLDAEQERAWAALSSAIGYPANWMSAIRHSLQKQGKSWHWQQMNAEQIQLPSSKLLEQGGEAILIINANTQYKAVSNTLLLAESCGATLSVVYTAKPPSMSDYKTPGEVDSEFVNALEFGRARLAKIEREAKDIGVKVNTSFIWADSIDKITKNVADADLVIDETA